MQYVPGTTISLTHLNHKKEPAKKRGKFQDFSPSQVQEMIAYLQSLYPQTTA